MTWAEFMNLDPLKIGIGTLVIIILAAFGLNPIRSFARKAALKNEADARQAEVEVEDAKARGRAIRREDEATDRWYHIAQRAYVERDTAIEAKHKATNEAQSALAKMQLDCIAEVRAVEQKAEEKITAAEARVTELATKVADRDLEILRLSKELATALANHHECMTRVEEMTATLNRRMDAAGFDPTRTNTS